jgi:hypothetical protein
VNELAACRVSKKVTQIGNPPYFFAPYPHLKDEKMGSVRLFATPYLEIRGLSQDEA